MRPTIRFIRRGRLVELVDVPPTMMLLDYLRENEGSTGTKEGCGEGDCGACTIALGRLRNGKLTYEAVNSCIQLLGQVDGSEVVTVEDLVQSGGTLHPVQLAMVENHASQCGFCTPGFIMSLFTLYQSTDGPVSRDEINTTIAGNLCRCTGYRPIVDAALAACAEPRKDRFRTGAGDMTGVLQFLSDGEDVFVGDDETFFAAPASLDSLAALYLKHPDAVIVAGATDVGLWITKQLRDIPKVIHVGKVASFDGVDDTGHEIIIGAGATYAQAEPYLAKIDPDVAELLRRLGSKQVRASGTVGGNVANGSPIGDTAAGADRARCEAGAAQGAGRCARCRSRSSTSSMASRSASPANWSPPSPCRASTPTISSAATRSPSGSTRTSPAVMAAFRFAVNADGLITDCRLAYGGMAGVPKRASNAEAALTGQQLRDSKAWARAFAALRDDFKPLDDHRASSRYRMETAHSLLGKALIEAAGTASNRTRIIGQRERAEANAG